MTVRWKPLLFLSGLFLVVALDRRRRHHIDSGTPFVPELLEASRAAREAGNFPNAEIDFKQALQLEPKNADDPRRVRQVLSPIGPRSLLSTSGPTSATSGWSI